MPGNPQNFSFHLRRYITSDIFDLVPFEPSSDFWSNTEKVVLTIHGWNSSSGRFSTFSALENEKTKVFALDWRKESTSLNYLKNFQNGRLVARQVAKFLRSALSAGVKAENIHLIGHSMGAHVASFIAKEIQNDNLKIGRVTGLDPAGPFFENCNKGARLDMSDADLVDIIHTNPGQLPSQGIDIPIGHFDYFIGKNTRIRWGRNFSKIYRKI